MKNEKIGSRFMRVYLFCILAILWSANVWAGNQINTAAFSLDLHGEGWHFAIDPADRGEYSGWHKPGRNLHAGWDAVTVPHDFLVDKRYEYSGVAWYRRSFPVPNNGFRDKTWRLQFEQVFQRCRVWLNGEEVGTHEGGYTPFEFSVAKFLKPGQENFLVVAVDNRVKFRALPGIRSGGTANAAQYPWLNYGGILGEVRLIGHDPVWVAAQKIETVLNGDAWKVSIRVDVRNDTDRSDSGRLTARLSPGQTELTGNYNVAPNSTTSFLLQGSIPRDAVQAWDLETPTLYESRVAIDSSKFAIVSTFGFRTIEIRDARFLLNGHPIRMAGANRARSHPEYGGIDTDEAVARDMKLMKEAGLVFTRIQHYPPRRNLLDWADQHGMLLVLEVGMWGYISPDQASEELRSQFQQEMGEMIAMARNHPSVVGWSIGNEYESWTPEGLDWTRDMAAFVKNLDSTRPVTFAALGGALRLLEAGEGRGEHAFDHVDFISQNYYFQPRQMAQFLDPVHVRWPGKPVMITEFGMRDDRVKNESERTDHFDAMLALVRERPWICGLAIWTFNDYRSRYPGTGADGYRRWGLVDEHRNPRPLYHHVAKNIRDGLHPPLEPMEKQ